MGTVCKRRASFGKTGVDHSIRSRHFFSCILTWHIGGIGIRNSSNVSQGPLRQTRCQLPHAMRADDSAARVPRGHHQSFLRLTRVQTKLLSQRSGSGAVQREKRQPVSHEFLTCNSLISLLRHSCVCCSAASLGHRFLQTVGLMISFSLSGRGCSLRVKLRRELADTYPCYPGEGDQITKL